MDLLNFIGDHKKLFKSYYFINFFETTQTNEFVEIATEELECPVEQDADYLKIDVANEESTCDSIKTDDDSYDSTLDILSDADQKKIGSDCNDYIYEAALEFSKAVTAEINLDYGKAIECYKVGIDILLRGIKTDSCKERQRSVAKKIKYYLDKTEKLLEQYSQNPSHVSVQTDESFNIESTKLSSKELKNFRIMRIIDKVIQVMNVKTKKTVIIKSSTKEFSDAALQDISLPNKIPFMIDLIGYIQTDNNLYFLLSVARYLNLINLLNSVINYDIHIFLVAVLCMIM